MLRFFHPSCANRFLIRDKTGYNCCQKTAPLPASGSNTGSSESLFSYDLNEYQVDFDSNLNEISLKFDSVIDAFRLEFINVATKYEILV